MTKLKSKVMEVKNLSQHCKEQMFDLYNTYYDSTNYEIFTQDLSKKDFVIILESSGLLQGFTTIELIESVYNNCQVLILYSGDTIIHKNYWGEQTLTLAWCEFAGKIKAQNPTKPLYWLLLTKGHRTYRYLGCFFKTFYPSYKTKTPASIKDFIDLVSLKKFAEFYNKENQTIEYDLSRGHLKSWLADEDRLKVNNKEV
jgi:hypothetical protein